MPAKILYFDIETTPVKGWTWGAYEQNVLEIIQDWMLLGFAYAWDDGPVVTVYPDKNGHSRDTPGYYIEWEGEAVLQLWELLDEADIVVAHNGQAFDVKKMNAKFIEYELGAPAPFLQIDTKKEATKAFKFTRNNLGEIGKRLDEGDKMKHTGFDMWTGCMDGVRTEWNRMERYNKKDVVLLRKIYKRIAPFMKNHPSVLDNDTDHLACHVCQSTKFIKRGFHKTASGIWYQRYQCTNGHYFRNRKRVPLGGKPPSTG